MIYIIPNNDRSYHLIMDYVTFRLKVVPLFNGDNIYSNLINELMTLL